MTRCDRGPEVNDAEALAGELQRLADDEGDNLPRLGPQHHPWSRGDWRRLGRFQAFTEAAKLVRKMAGIPESTEPELSPTE